MSAKKADEKKQAAAPKAEAKPAEKADEVVCNAIIAELDRVHVRTPRY
ncbi:MAG: hypothetical protein LBP22_05165 [Deltaproteobacteria bacterium]|jgi:hypothetical protein|nr:hypothetical protein [Deltaproteobacteria bacterium]